MSELKFKFTSLIVEFHSPPLPSVDETLTRIGLIGEKKLAILLF